MASPAIPPFPGLFAPPILHSALDRLTSHLNTPPPSSSGLEEPLQTLHAALLRIAKMVPTKSACSPDLMSQLGDVAYAADDLVDELEYRALQQRVEDMAKASADQTAGGLNLSVFKGFQTGETDAVYQPVIPSQAGGESSVTRSGGSTVNQTGGGSSPPVLNGTGPGGEGEGNQTNCATGKHRSNKRRSGYSVTLFSCFHGRDRLTDQKFGASSNSFQAGELTYKRSSKGSSLTLFKHLRSVICKIIKWRRKEVVHRQVGDDATDRKIGSSASLRDDANKNHFKQGKDGPNSTQNNAMNEATDSSDSMAKDDEGTTNQVTVSKLPEISYEEDIATRIKKIAEQLDLILVN